jgi:hypothetical protein
MFALVTGYWEGGDMCIHISMANLVRSILCSLGSGLLDAPHVQLRPRSDKNGAIGKNWILGST